ncbi:MAG TPA: cytochrome c1 [Xanthobacteraceae bacterium]|nr:cytochrome c1 [Xanthobacteraceae bacterium]
MRKIALILFAGAALATSSAFAQEQQETPIPPRQSWSFAGPFGTFDRAQIQRGFHVYRDVCSACHGMKYLSFRNLAQPGGPGYTEAQAKQVASEYRINDGPNDKGEMFDRPGRLSDYFPSPDPNEQAARARFNGALPPDLSVIAKARGAEAGFPAFVFDAFRQYQEAGPDYIFSYVTGYENPPADVKLADGQFWNKYFPGHRTAMRPPLQNGQVEYTDGTPATVEQYARDVSAFLMWVAEPNLEARKRIGFQVMIFLIIFAGLAYFTKKKVWSGLH